MSLTGIITGGILPIEIENYILYLVKLQYDIEKKDYLERCKKIIIRNRIMKPYSFPQYNYILPPDLFGRRLVSPRRVIDTVELLNPNEIIQEAYTYHFEELTGIDFKNIYIANNKICIKREEVIHYFKPEIINFNGLKWKDYSYFKKENRLIDYQNFKQFLCHIKN